MHLQEIEKIIKLIDGTTITDFDYDTSDIKISIRKYYKGHMLFSDEEEDDFRLQQHDIISSREEFSPTSVTINTPIVGIFSNIDENTNKPFVNVGDSVVKGQVVCVIDSLKIYNKIISPQDGIVEKILCIDNQVVDFGQTLMLIKKYSMDKQKEAVML